MKRILLVFLLTCLPAAAAEPGRGQFDLLSGRGAAAPEQGRPVVPPQKPQYPGPDEALIIAQRDRKGLIIVRKANQGIFAARLREAEARDQVFSVAPDNDERFVVGTTTWETTPPEDAFAPSGRTGPRDIIVIPAGPRGADPLSDANWERRTAPSSRPQTQAAPRPPSGQGWQWDAARGVYVRRMEGPPPQQATITMPRSPAQAVYYPQPAVEAAHYPAAATPQTQPVFSGASCRG